MAEEDRVPLLAEFDDGTKIYKNGVLKSESFFEVSFFNFKCESTYDFNSKDWGKLERQDRKFEIQAGSGSTTASAHIPPLAANPQLWSIG